MAAQGAVEPLTAILPFAIDSYEQDFKEHLSMIRSMKSSITVAML